MANTKGPYDPVKAIEGMFNGSVTRIAYALKDPTGYSGSTKTVLAECAKRFHDALDDCEIQLLDAKWFLEHQLRTNRLRREAQAREQGTAAKRKHNEISDANELIVVDESTTKKMKIESVPDLKDAKDKTPTKEAALESKAEPSNDTDTAKATPQLQQLKTEKSEKQQPSSSSQNIPSTQPKPPPEPPRLLVKEQQQQPTADDFAKPTPQATPTGTNDEFDFESMFAEPPNEAMEDLNKDNIDLEFDFTTGDFGADKDDGEDMEPPSLDTLLPGLESYANQTDDNMLTNANASMGMNTNTINNTSNSNVQDIDALPSFSNDLDIDKPDLEGPNIFDDFFNDDGDGAGGNYVDNIDLSDSALLDLDFDSFQ